MQHSWLVIAAQLKWLVIRASQLNIMMTCTASVLTCTALWWRDSISIDVYSIMMTCTASVLTCIALWWPAQHQYWRVQHYDDLHSFSIDVCSIMMTCTASVLTCAALWWRAQHQYWRVQHSDAMHSISIDVYYTKSYCHGQKIGVQLFC